MKKTKKTRKSSKKVPVSKIAEMVNFSGVGSVVSNSAIRVKDIADKQLARLWKSARKTLKEIKKVLKQKK